MILNVNGESFITLFRRKALWHGPGFENALEFQAEIVVQLSRGVLLDDEEAAVGGAGAAERLGRPAGVTLLSVVVEVGGHRYPLGASSPWP